MIALETKQPGGPHSDLWGGGVFLGETSHSIQSKMNIRMDLQEVGCGYMDWIGLAQDRDRWRHACECSNEPSGSVKCGEFLD